MAEPDEGRYVIVEERLIPIPESDDVWVVTWRSIEDEAEIRRRMSAEEYDASVAGPREEKPLWKQGQIEPIGEPDDG